MTELDRRARWDAVAAHAGALRAALGRRHGPADAEDIAQETLLRAVSANAPVPAGPKTVRWLSKIARNLGIDSWRRRREHATLDIAGHVPALSLDVDRLLDVERALAQLSRNDRQLLWSVATGMGYSEIAGSERTSAIVIRKRVARARARLLQFLTEGRR